MLRTKLSHVNEGGVAAGLGALDSVIIIFKKIKLFSRKKKLTIKFFRSFWLMLKDAAKFQKAAAKTTVVFVVKKPKKLHYYIMFF